MTNYPYPALIDQLKFLVSPQEYTATIERNRVFAPSNYYYREILPEYIYAKCPICGCASVEKFDTYSLQDSYELENTLIQPLGRNSKFPKQPCCEHYLGVHQFINLHGITELPLKSISFESGDIPYLSLPLFELVKNEETYATIHALPICRIANDQFMPAYTHYILTYFMTNREAFIEAYLQRESARYEIYEEIADPLASSFYPADVANSPTDIDMIEFNLQKYAEQGKLGWLDFNQPDLPLILEKGASLPDIYKDVEGYGKKYSWNLQFSRFIIRD